MITIGVLGAGQLGRMLALAGIPLGMRFRFYDPVADPAAGAVGEHTRASWDDHAALLAWADSVDAITYESETVPLNVVRSLMDRRPVRPGSEALRIGGDRLLEKEFLSELGIPVAPFASVMSRDELASALEHLGTPSILKTRGGGYDGRGQVSIADPAGAAAAWDALGAVPATLERRVEFQRELAIVAVRGLDRRIITYPLTETRHECGILVSAVAPALRVTEAMKKAADSIATRVLEALDHVGVLAIECFEVNGHLMVNEFAPRVHNSGHWTIEGAVTSQFENHVRAIAGLPLGSTESLGHCGLVNLLGEIPVVSEVLALPWTHLHVYGKASRPGRKVGHVTVLANDPHLLSERLQHVINLTRSNADSIQGSLS